jgi:chorismate-pyruvate lyase
MNVGVRDGARLVALLAALFACLSTAAEAPPRWPDNYVARLQALALVQTLNGQLLASRSSTLTLEAWCRDHRLADDPRIVAELLKNIAKSATAEQRQRLQVTFDDEVQYRRVRLRCGDRVLSEADNWYVPGRLTADMNRLLETTDTPFGKAVQALEPYRQTFAVKLLWSPLPDGWELRPILSSTGTTGQ